jgi:hypothetical protein
MTMPVAASTALTWWSSYYGNHQTLSLGIRYVHLAALVVGGGAAITFDQQLRKARRAGDAARAVSLDLLDGSHRIVIPSLTLIVFSGILMTAADFETYMASRVFWTKIALILLLVINGSVLVTGERLARRGDAQTAWRRLGVTSRTSQILWLLIVLVSCWLVVAA